MALDVQLEPALQVAPGVQLGLHLIEAPRERPAQAGIGRRGPRLIVLGALPHEITERMDRIGLVLLDGRLRAALHVDNHMGCREQPEAETLTGRLPSAVVSQGCPQVSALAACDVGSRRRRGHGRRRGRRRQHPEVVGAKTRVVRLAKQPYPGVAYLATHQLDCLTVSAQHRGILAAGRTGPCQWS